MAGLELAQRQDIDLTGDAVVMVAALDAQDIAPPAVLVGRADAAVAVAAVVALNNVGVHIQRGGLHQRVESVGVAVPFRYEQGINLAAQVSTVAYVG